MSKDYHLYDRISRKRVGKKNYTNDEGYAEANRQNARLGENMHRYTWNRNDTESLQPSKRGK